MLRMVGSRPLAVAFALVAVTVFEVGGAGCAAGEQDDASSRLERLPALDAHGVTVSGVSSGGAMAVQFHVAHSSLVQGAGVLAAPPYGCAEASVAHALGRCMKDGADIPVDALRERAQQLAASGAIDPLAALGGDRVWLYRGADDPYVAASVADALERFYRPLIAPAQPVRVEGAGAAHNFPTARADAANCGTSEPPYLGACDFDATRELLAHLYGELAPNAASGVDGAGAPQSPAAGSRAGEAHDVPLREFDQRPYARESGSAGLDDRGFIFVPRGCEGNGRAGGKGARSGEGDRMQGPQSCRLHVVFHGCRQGVEGVGDAFVRRAGYLEVAEANRIVVLFPQVKPTTLPLNPMGCWDWWGYEGEDYDTRAGKQVAAVRAMVDDMLGTTTPAR